MSEKDFPINLDHKAPYKRTVDKYLDKGWPSPLILPPAEKWKPPTGFTGNEVITPDEKTLLKFKNKRWEKSFHREGYTQSNICQRLPHKIKVGKRRWDVIGIDVDDYVKGKKEKHGGDQLSELEEELGPLPDTWISSARRDGVSGMRMFLVPPDLKWNGQVAKDIECVSPYYRYAVVAPSVHPMTIEEDELYVYMWYPPGNPPTGSFEPEKGFGTDGTDNGDGTRQVRFLQPTENSGNYFPIPSPKDFAILPDKWVDRLTDGRRSVTFDIPKDKASSWADVDKWANGLFVPGRGEPCSMIKKVRKSTLQKIEDATTHHDLLTSMENNILRLGMEGHPGWLDLLEEVDNAWIQSVHDNEKRSLDELTGEMFRSRSGALRKIKGEVEQARERGIRLYSDKCLCFDATDDPVANAEKDRPPGEFFDPTTYKMSDDGDAEHLYDMYFEHLMFIPERNIWFQWDGKRWVKDPSGRAEMLPRKLFEKVRDRQEFAAYQLMEKAEQLEDPDIAKKLAGKWLQRALQSGNAGRQRAVVDCLKKFPGVVVPDHLIDANTHLLAVESGVIELNENGILRREISPKDYITMCADADWVPTKDQKTDPEHKRGWKIFDGFIHECVDDEAMLEFLGRLVGAALLGYNKPQLGVWLKGPGNSGKGTLLNLLWRAMGDYAGPFNATMFKTKTGINQQLADVLTKRVIFASETSEKMTLHPDAYKTMTGRDPLSAEIKYGGTICRVPCFTPIISCNSAPNFNTPDMSVYRRVAVVEFPNSRTGADVDDNLGPLLEEECRTAFLSWAIEGYMRYAQKGLGKDTWPIEAKRLSKNFYDEMSDFGAFAGDWLEFTGDDKDRIHSEMMQKVFMSWVVQQAGPSGRIPDVLDLGNGGMAKELSARGAVCKNGIRHPSNTKNDKGIYYRGRGYAGVKWKEDKQKAVKDIWKGGKIHLAMVRSIR